MLHRHLGNYKKGALHITLKEEESIPIGISIQRLFILRYVYYDTPKTPIRDSPLYRRQTEREPYEQ